MLIYQKNSRSGCSFFVCPAIYSNMINIRIFRTVLSFDFSFFAVIAMCLLFDDSAVCLFSLIFSAVHELGHLVTMTFYGQIPDRIVFYGAGIKICSDISCLRTYKKIIVLLSGCSANLLIAVMALLSGNVLAASINIIMALFNMLPIGHLDGGHILRVCLEKNYNCDAVMRFIGVSFAVVLLIISISFNALNLSLILTVIYIICMMVYY